jgi:hypothetical protein
MEWFKSLGMTLIGALIVFTLIFDWHESPVAFGLVLAVFGGLAFLLGLVVMLFKGEDVSRMQYVMILAAIPLGMLAYLPGVDQPVSFTSVIFRFAAIVYGGLGVFLSLRSLFHEAREFVS